MIVQQLSCDYCGSGSGSEGVRLCRTCTAIEFAAKGDLSREAMILGAVQLWVEGELGEAALLDRLELWGNPGRPRPAR